MARKLVFLVCGPPASGKDTLTAQLCDYSTHYMRFQKHRGLSDLEHNANDSTYINIPITEFEQLANEQFFVQHHNRYDRAYGIAKSELERITIAHIPIIHTGALPNLLELERKLIEYRCIKILLWAPLEVLKQRLINRHINAEQIPKRIAAANEEFTILADAQKITPLKSIFDVVIATHNRTFSVKELEELVHHNFDYFKLDTMQLQAYLQSIFR